MRKEKGGEGREGEGMLGKGREGKRRGREGWAGHGRAGLKRNLTARNLQILGDRRAIFPQPGLFVVMVKESNPVKICAGAHKMLIGNRDKYINQI